MIRSKILYIPLSKTKLFSKISIKIHVSLRHYPGSDRNIAGRVIKEAAKKCQGGAADCSTPTIVQQGNKPTSKPKSNTNVHTTNDKKEVTSKGTEKITNDQETTKRHKNIQKDIQPMQDKFKDSAEKPSINSIQERLERENKKISVQDKANLKQTKEFPEKPIMPPPISPVLNNAEKFVIETKIPPKIRMHSRDPMKATNSI